MRDVDIDDEFMTLIKARPNVFVIPNLPERETNDDLSWLNDTVPAAEIQRMRDERGTSFIFSTHDAKIMSEAEHLFALEDGRLTRSTAREAAHGEQAQGEAAHA